MARHDGFGVAVGALHPDEVLAPFREVGVLDIAEAFHARAAQEAAGVEDLLVGQVGDEVVGRVAGAGIADLDLADLDARALLAQRGDGGVGYGPAHARGEGGRVGMGEDLHAVALGRVHALRAVGMVVGDDHAGDGQAGLRLHAVDQRDRRQLAPRPVHQRHRLAVHDDESVDRNRVLAGNAVDGGVHPDARRELGQRHRIVAPQIRQEAVRRRHLGRRGRRLRRLRAGGQDEGGRGYEGRACHERCHGLGR